MLTRDAGKTVGWNNKRESLRSNIQYFDCLLGGDKSKDSPDVLLHGCFHLHDLLVGTAHVAVARGAPRLLVGWLVDGCVVVVNVCKAVMSRKFSRINAARFLFGTVYNAFGTR